MPRIVLRTPFIHHYAGSVFDLERSTVTPNWEFEDRSSPPRTYFLPDNGKGLGVDLPMSDTGICLPSIFVGVDLTTGPCRITSARTMLTRAGCCARAWPSVISRRRFGDRQQGVVLRRFMSLRQCHRDVLSTS